MASRVRQDHSNDDAGYLLPAEIFLIGHTLVGVVVVSWIGGGMITSTQGWLAGLLALSVGAIVLRRRESASLSWIPLLPVLLWLAFVGAALLNPSHDYRPPVGWLQREEWIAWLPTTIDPPRTRAAGIFWLLALLSGGVFSLVLRSTRAARILWIGIALNGSILALVGAFFRFSNAQLMLGFMETPEPTYFFATFFYKNHWAAFGALSAVASCALATQAWPGTLAGDPRARGRALFFGAAGVLTAATLPLPGSRAGAAMAVAITLGFAALLAGRSWRALRRGAIRRSRFVLAGVLAALVIGGIAAFGVKAYAPRAAQDIQRTQQQLAGVVEGETLDIRMKVSRDTWQMAQARPWFGWGPGCYEVVFPRFQGAYLRGPDGRPSARVEYAHNDWLQLPAEAGFLGAALLILPAIIAGWRTWCRASTSGRWGLGGCVMIAAHAVIDFPLHNPAVLLVWIVMLTTAHRLSPRTVLEAQPSR